jgi:hypothetical protein
MEQGFNMMPLLVALGQAVPVWVIVALAVKHYLEKNAQDQKFSSVSVWLRSKPTSANIQLSLAGAGIREGEIEKLRESRAQFKVQIEALWRALDEYRGHSVRRPQMEQHES